MFQSKFNFVSYNFYWKMDFIEVVFVAFGATLFEKSKMDGNQYFHLNSVFEWLKNGHAKYELLAISAKDLRSYLLMENPRKRDTK